MSMPEWKKDELLRELERDKQLELIEWNRARITAKSNMGNVERIMHIQRREQKTAEDNLKLREDKAFKEKEMEREEKLAMELDKIKRDELRQLKERQILRANSVELRELESKLKAAYVAKDLHAQIAQKEAERLQDKIREQESFKRLQTAWLKEDEYRQKLMQDEINKKALYRRQLQDQMIINEKRKRYAFEQYLQEKKLIDDIIMRMHEEDMREIEDKMCKMKKTREEMNAFKAAQQIWRKKERDELELENRQIQEYIMSKANQMQMREEKKNEMEEVKAKLLDNLSKQLAEAEAKKKEREDILMELQVEEQKQALDQKHRESVEKELRNRIEVRESLGRQMKERDLRLKQAAEEDARFKNELLAQLAEDNRLEQLSNQKRRLKMIQLRKDVEQMINDRRQRYAEEMQIQMKLKEHDEFMRKERMRIIEEERLRMLKEHAKNVLGFIPRGVLREDDLPHLGSDLVK